MQRPSRSLPLSQVGWKDLLTDLIWPEGREDRFGRQEASFFWDGFLQGVVVELDS